MTLEIHIHKRRTKASLQAARLVAREIKQSNAAGKPLLLGLPIGETPQLFYRHLTRIINRQRIDLSNVHVVNFDEWWPLQRNHPAAFRTQLARMFLDHVRIPRQNLHLLDSAVSKAEREQHLRQLDSFMGSFNGTVLHVHGLGADGHFGGVNEDVMLSSKPSPRIHTRAQPIRSFSSFLSRRFSADLARLRKRPTHALTVGLYRPYRADKVVVLAFGEKKAGAVAGAIEAKKFAMPRDLEKHKQSGIWPSNRKAPASVVVRRQKGNVLVMLDKAAASELRKTNRKAQYFEH